jgi:outer membrane protein TolC
MNAVSAGDTSGKVWTAAAALVLILGLAAPVAAQQAQARRISLADALRLAEDASESVAIAHAGVMRSGGELKRARSEYFPQVFASASYTRTLDSEFSAFGSASEPDTTSAEPCGSFVPNPSLPIDARVDSLEAAVRCQSDENPFEAFSDLPFGRENQWRLDLSVSQTVFSGGRVGAQSDAAKAGRRVAELDLTSSRASLMLDVASAYYDAALADRLLQIAEATLTQAESTLDQVRLARQVGNQPEFELLRAQVTRDNQRPVVIQRRADRALAYIRLAQLLDLPADAQIDLTSGLDGGDITEVVRIASDVVGVVGMDTTAATRSAVLQAAEAVRIQEAQLTIARAQRLPSLSLSMQYGRVGYPEEIAPFDAQFRTNWTVGASIQLPLFTGGRISGESQIARANLEEARARFELTREAAALDTREAHERLAAAEAAWEASSGTVQQANQAYSIAEVRFTEGISTQLELNDSRILLQQAQANRAQAARDLQIARLRTALLPYLPLSGGGAAGLRMQQALPQATQQQMTTPAAQSGIPTQSTGAAAAGANGTTGGR